MPSYEYSFSVGMRFFVRSMTEGGRPLEVQVFYSDDAPFSTEMFEQILSKKFGCTWMTSVEDAPGRSGRDHHVAVLKEVI